MSEAAPGNCRRRSHADQYDVIKRPIVTEKAVTKKDDEQSLCFEVIPSQQAAIKKAVETLFKVKVSDVRTSNYVGKLRRRGGCGLCFGLEQGLREIEARPEDAETRRYKPCQSVIRRHNAGIRPL